MIRMRYIQHTAHHWDRDEDAVVASAAESRKSLSKTARTLGLTRRQVEYRAKSIGIAGNGNDLRPGIIDALKKLLHPMRPVTRAMLTKASPGHRVSLHRVITRMLQTGELLGSPKDIRLPDSQPELTGDASDDESRKRRTVVQNRAASAAQCVR